MYTIPRQYLYCEQTTSGSIVSALYRLDIRCIVYDTAPISILCANNIRPIYNLYCSIVSALYRLDIRYTVYTILGQYPYCVQTIITQYWANTCMYRKRIPIQYRANFTLFPGIRWLHAAPVVFEVYTVAPCISRLNVKGLHAFPILFEGTQMQEAAWSHRVNFIYYRSRMQIF